MAHKKFITEAKRIIDEIRESRHYDAYKGHEHHLDTVREIGDDDSDDVNQSDENRVMHGKADHVVKSKSSAMEKHNIHYHDGHTLVMHSGEAHNRMGDKFEGKLHPRHVQSFYKHLDSHEED